jgi:hypothetical protein
MACPLSVLHVIDGGPLHACRHDTLHMQPRSRADPARIPFSLITQRPDDHIQPPNSPMFRCWSLCNPMQTRHAQMGLVNMRPGPRLPSACCSGRPHCTTRTLSGPGFANFGDIVILMLRRVGYSEVSSRWDRIAARTRPRWRFHCGSSGMQECSCFRPQHDQTPTSLYQFHAAPAASLLSHHQAPNTFV